MSAEPKGITDNLEYLTSADDLKEGEKHEETIIKLEDMLTGKLTSADLRLALVVCI